MLKQQRTPRRRATKRSYATAARGVSVKTKRRPLPQPRERAITRSMERLADLAISVVQRHPSVIGVELAGSRARGTYDEVSDWDFAICTSDFDSIARDLPALVEPLDPLGAEWEPLGPFPVYALMLRGPTVVEYLFLERSQKARTPVTPTEESLPAINAHFWAWMWWLATKASVGHADLLGPHWPRLYGHMLEPMGASTAPDSIETAIDTFVPRRDELEQEYGLELSRALENEVLEGIRRLGYAA